MSKVTLQTIGNLTNESSAINILNGNFQTLQNALDTLFSRDGLSPNTLIANVDANSQRITNLPVPVDNADAARKVDVDSAASSAQVAYEEARTKYNQASTKLEDGIAEVNAAKVIVLAAEDNVEAIEDNVEQIQTDLEASISGLVEEAPEDGEQYARQNGDWAVVSGGGDVDSVNGATGVVVLDADDIDDSGTTNKFTTQADIDKLAGIESGAEVNDVTSVNGQTGDVVVDTGDPFADDVLLHCSFDGAEGSATVTDIGPDERTVTLNGNAYCDTTNPKFGPSSMALDGTGDYASVPNDAAFGFSGDFTVEAWIYPTAIAATDPIIGFYNAGDQLSWLLYLAGTSILFSRSGTGTSPSVVIAETSGISTDAWYHVAACRSSGMLRIFVNGAMVGSVADAVDYFDSTAPLTIGTYLSSGTPSGNAFNGNIDEVRITNAARYATDDSFDVPEYPYQHTRVPVASVFGRVGPVLAAASDYDADQIDYDNTSSGLTATDVQDAIDEVHDLVIATGSILTAVDATTTNYVTGGSYTNTTFSTTTRNDFGGGAWDGTTFTVPADGTYDCYINLSCTTNAASPAPTSADVHFLLNGSSQPGFMKFTNGVRQNVGLTRAVLTLEEGDTLVARARFGSGSVEQGLSISTISIVKIG